MKRIALDITLLLILLFTMSFHFIPKILHEALGIAMLLTISAHLAWNRAWFATFFKGRWSVLRCISCAVNLLMIGSILAVTVTGCFISNHLFKGWFGIELARSIFAHQLHVSLPYLLLILSGVHLGLHWDGLWLRLAKGRSPGPVGRFLMQRLLPALVSCIGIYGSFLNRVGDRLLMKHIFGTEATNLPFAAYFILLIGIVGLYAIFGHLLRKLLIGTPPLRGKKQPHRDGI